MALLPHSYFRFLHLGNENAWRLLEQTLCDSQLPTSKITNFNDPFEVGPILVGDRSKRISIDGTYSVKTVWSPLMKPAWTELIGKSLLADELIDFYASYFSVVSFSRRINSGLLWSHYTNGYRGIALHFTPSNAPNSPFNRSQFEWLTYEKQRPVISLDRLRHYFDTTQPHPAGAFTLDALGALELQLVSALLFWKSDDWEYEQEARIVARADHGRINFPAEELVSIILGPRCVDRDAERISELASRCRTDLNVVKAKLSRTDYSVEIDW